MILSECNSRSGYMVVINDEAFSVPPWPMSKWLDWMSAETLQSSWRRTPKIGEEFGFPEELENSGFVRVMCPNMTFIVIAPSNKSEKLADTFVKSFSFQSLCRKLTIAAEKASVTILGEEEVKVRKVRRSA